MRSLAIIQPTNENGPNRTQPVIQVIDMFHTPEGILPKKKPDLEYFSNKLVVFKLEATDDTGENM